MESSKSMKESKTASLRDLFREEDDGAFRGGL
jgi:hypothetical protein